MPKTTAVFGVIMLFHFLMPPSKSLHQAAWDGNVDEVRRNLLWGSKLNEQNQNRETPLALAAYVSGRGDGNVAPDESARKETIVKMLIKAGANPNLGAPVLTPLHDAGSANIAETLISAGAEVDSAPGSSMRTPLHEAARRGYVDVVEVLLKHGANVQGAPGTETTTPLHKAAQKGHLAVVDLLLKHGADIDAGSNMGWTPLMWAVENQHSVVAGELIRRGANMVVESRDGRSLTDRAVTAEMTELLREAGCHASACPGP